MATTDKLLTLLIEVVGNDTPHDSNQVLPTIQESSNINIGHCDELNKQRDCIARIKLKLRR